ncbi:hypothetical protein DB88DRAFT_531566 [Papiliotrema laurentii]|uniref:Uncharacterized protein n=1 Tax=Papiliotrema laurentii TaxID=5418 RepID=A0AAD9CY06_PAPLA|nr:hypothetical protein DB88DRAFT_531566 [Papiliotrema laurentii]
MGQKSPTNAKEHKVGGWKFERPPEVRPGKVDQLLEAARNRWGRSDVGETNCQTDLEGSKLISCISDSVAMIMSDLFKGKTNLFVTDCPPSLETYYANIRPQGLVLSQLSLARGSRQQGKRKATNPLEELRQKHDSLLLTIDSVRAFTSTFAPGDSAKRTEAAKSFEALAPTCTCRDSTCNDNRGRWRKANIPEESLKAIVDTSSKLQERYRAYIDGKVFTEPEKLANSSSTPSDRPPTPFGGARAPESPPENWFDFDEEETTLQGPDGNGDSGSKDGQDEKPDEGDPNVPETTGVSLGDSPHADDGEQEVDDGFTLVTRRRRG